MDRRHHIPVLLRDSLLLLSPLEGKTFADLTLGEGGHTDALLEGGAAKVFAMDRDSEAIRDYQQMGRFFHDPRLCLIHDNFSNLQAYVSPSSLDGVIADLGVSTYQILHPNRGFSFQFSAPLDMRMNANDESLESILQRMSLEDLADWLKKNTGIKRGKEFAYKILTAFREGKLKNTLDLANLFSKQNKKRVHPATVVFLGLRMMVNQELAAIETGFQAALECLKPGGRLVVITFHSSEDRYVKRSLLLTAGKCVCGGPPPICRCPKKKMTNIVLKHPITPTREDIRRNPRSRSAKLRCVEKLAVQG